MRFFSGGWSRGLSVRMDWVSRQGDITRTNDESEIFVRLPEGTPAGVCVEVTLQPLKSKAVTVRTMVPKNPNGTPATVIALPLEDRVNPNSVVTVKRLSVTSRKLEHTVCIL